MTTSRTVSLYQGTRNITFTPDGHGYLVHEKGKSAPGVTEMLKATCPKEAIAYWMLNTGLGYVDAQVKKGRNDMEAILIEAKTEHRRISTEGIGIGKAVHKWIEEFVKNPSTPMWPVGDPQLRKACEAFVQWFDAHRVKVLESEKIVYSDPMFYCGTLDLLALVDGELAIVDLKASSGYYREMGLQIGGYALAYEHETGETINHGWVVILDKKTGLPKPHYIPIRRQLKDDFARCVDWYRSLQRLDWLTEEIKDATAAGTRAGLGSIKPDLLESLKG